MSYTPELIEDLQISETRYRRLFETARDGILILDAETRKITDVNPFMIELLDYIDFNEFVEAANQLGVYWLGVNRSVYPK